MVTKAWTSIFFALALNLRHYHEAERNMMLEIHFSHNPARFADTSGRT